MKRHAGDADVSILAPKEGNGLRSPNLTFSSTVFTVEKNVMLKRIQIILHEEESNVKRIQKILQDGSQLIVCKNGTQTVIETGDSREI